MLLAGDAARNKDAKMSDRVHDRLPIGADFVDVLVEIQVYPRWDEATAQSGHRMRQIENDLLLDRW
jgi:hypothetical protein